ncbi:hypothetical protein R3P38DRAFT_2852159 [Favolaschia claudopus]|uniref:Uncharacterized protein n=1 Tax=Favolaschia claudopus TaxID=2862362 RepID=A0AAW0DRP3_9AGAR
MTTHSSSTSRAASVSLSSESDSPTHSSPSKDSASASRSTRGAFYRSDSTFNPSPYNPPQKANSLYRTTSLAPGAGAAPFDAPQATTPPFDGSFVRPPFNNLPDGVLLPPEGMNYSVMHQHPTWFLDIKDFITLDSPPNSAVRYPRDLEPPRPRRQKDLLLRCTFCPRTYAGVNAKSMWTRHVREKHRVILSKAWSDTTTSSRRQPSIKPPSIVVPVLSVDTTSPTPIKLPIKLPAASGSKAPAPLPPPKPAAPKGKPGPKPGFKAAKTGSPTKGKKDKVVSGPRKIVIPAQRPKPVPQPAPWVKSLSPPPPVGVLPPRMRLLGRKSFGGSQASISLTLGEQSISTPPSLEPGFASADAESISAPAALNGEPTPPPTASSDLITASDEPAIDPVVDHPTTKSSEDEDSLQDQEVADLLLMDVDNTFVDEPDEDVDMELEDDEEVYHPPISLGGLLDPMFGVEEPHSDPFSLSSRPLVAMSPIFSPALSPVVPQSNETSSREHSVEHSVSDVRPATPLPSEPPEPEEPPPLGHFKVSSLAYLMDKSLSVSPPHSPPPPSRRSLTPQPTPQLTSTDEPPTATLFSAMQDVFVLKMQKMEPELKARFLGHLQEQFGVEVNSDPPPAQSRDESVRWASLPETIIRQIMSEHARSNEIEDEAGDSEAMAVDDELVDSEFSDITAEFKQDSAEQLKDDLDDQLKALVGSFSEELVAPLQDALTLQLKDEIIVQVADQMMEALAVQGEEAQVEFEWRRRFLERQLWTEQEQGIEGQDDDELIQHPLHHLLPSKALPADMDVRIPTPLQC